ncbi:hypothetical protein NST62_07040 [Ureibacillus sp. FSL K6-8385]|nr:hypothetical protein [Ureibacillus terrenus]
MMKKIYFPIALLLLFLLLAACGETTEENVNGKVENTEQTSEDTGTDEEEERANEINQVIVDNENVKATLVKIVKKEDPIWGRSIEVIFDVQNKRQDSIEVQARSVSADGRMVDEALLTMSQEVAPGKSATAKLTIQEFEGYEFPELKENFEMTLHIFSWDQMDYQEDHPVKVTF